VEVPPNSIFEMKFDEYIKQLDEAKKSVLVFTRQHNASEISPRIEELPVIKYGEYDKIFSLEDWNKFVGGGVLTAPIRIVYMQRIEKLKFELHEIHAGLGTVLFMLKAA